MFVKIIGNATNLTHYFEGHELKGHGRNIVSIEDNLTRW